MMRCMSCRSIFHGPLAIHGAAGGECPICRSNDLIAMSPDFNAANGPAVTGHVVPSNTLMYDELKLEAVLMSSIDGTDYYYAPTSREYVAVLPGGRIASGSHRHFKHGPVAAAREAHLSFIRAR